MGDNPFDFARFTRAQKPIYDTALAEIKRGKKVSHWMWFIFPQIAGLGFSAMAQRYAIQSLEEARAYLAHPVLGARLRECAEAVLAVEGCSALGIFGSPDDVKLQSSMTLFGVLDGEKSLFLQVLDTYFDGVKDSQTVARVAMNALDKDR